MHGARKHVMLDHHSVPEQTDSAERRRDHKTMVKPNTTRLMAPIRNRACAMPGTPIDVAIVG